MNCREKYRSDSIAGTVSTNGSARKYRIARGHAPYRRIAYALVAPRKRGEIGRLAESVFEQRYGGLRGVRDLDYVLMMRALGGRARSRGELLSFLLFDEAFVGRLIEMGRRDAGRWLRRHPGFWCREADHDLSIGSLDNGRLSEQEALDEFRALHRR